MTIEFSFETGIFETYEICTGEHFGKVVDYFNTDWYIYVYTDINKIPNMVFPAAFLECRYQGIVFDMNNKEHQVMLKKKLEADFAIERLE